MQMRDVNISKFASELMPVKADRDTLNNDVRNAIVPLLTAGPATQQFTSNLTDAIMRAALWEKQRGASTSDAVDAAVQDITGNFNVQDGTFVPKDWPSGMTPKDYLWTVNHMFASSDINGVSAQWMTENPRFVLTPDNSGYEVQNSLGPIMVNGKPLRYSMSDMVHYFSEHHRKEKTPEEKAQQVELQAMGMGMGIQ